MARPPHTQPSPLCELCHSSAHLICPSDDAFLCWCCDSMVHSANFLVARHHRTYLCSCCACPTAVFARGAILPFRSHLCARCSIIPTEDCCATGSGNSDSECSALTSDYDAESAPTPGSRRSGSIRSSFTDQWEESFEFEEQVPNGTLDIFQNTDVSDGMSGVEDELSSSEEFGATSPTSYIGSDSPGSSVSASRHERTSCRSSRA